jgi:hypothetical protein
VPELPNRQPDHIDILATVMTCLRFDPEKVFHVSIWCTTVQALCFVE